MTLKLPDNFRGIDGKKAYERIMNEPDEQETKEDKENIKPASFNTDIVKSDYIQIPNQDFIIAIAETDFNLNYENAHKSVLKKGLAVPRINQFMKFRNYVIDSYKNSKTIFDAEGNPISEKTKDDLYKEITQDCWTWLNAKFYIDNKKTIEYVTGIDSNDNLITKTENLENCLMKNCYIDFKKLNKQGIPKPDAEHSNQEFEKTENIYYWAPKDKKVARFYADSDGTSLICSRVPSNEASNLGVRGVLLDKNKLNE